MHAHASRSLELLKNAEMIALEISVNGQRACLAGASGCVYTTLHWTRFVVNEGRLRIGVGGREFGQPKGGDFYEWSVPEIKFGDEVTIRILDTDAVDAPSKVRPNPPA